MSTKPDGMSEAVWEAAIAGYPFDGQRLHEARAHAIIAERMASDVLISQLQDALREALDSWEENTWYKSDYLRVKHGDAEEIAKHRRLLPS